MSSLNRLQALIAQYCARPTPTDPDTTLEALGIDSLGVIELLFEVEEAFGIRIDPDSAQSLRTVGEVAEHIDRLVAARDGGAPLDGADVLRAG